MSEAAEKIPETFEEAFAAFIEGNPMETVDYIRNLDEDDWVIQAHRSMGQGIRNAWWLWWQPCWKEDFADRADIPKEEPPLVKLLNELGLTHGDDRSSILFRTWHRQLNDKPWDLSGQAQHFIEYWAKPENQT